MEKLSKALALYVFNPPSNYTCSECAYGSGGHCSQFLTSDDVIKPYGSCNLWDWDKGGYLKINGPHSRTKEATGYMENKAGFSCARCEEFLADTKACKKVESEGVPANGKIEPTGCCSRWEKSPMYGDMTNKELKDIANRH